MKSPLALRLPNLPPNYAGFIQGLQCMFYVDEYETVVEDQDVNGADLVQYVADWLEKLDLAPVSDPRSFWLSEG